MIELRPRLRKFAIHGSRGADSLRTALAPYFADQLLEPERGSKDFTARISLCRLEKMEVYHGSYEQPFRLQLRHARCFTQGFPIRGGGEYVNNGTAMASSPRKGMLAEPGCIGLSYGPNFEHVSIFIDPDALSKTLAALVGMPPTGQLKLNMDDYGSRPEARMMRRLVNLLMAELDDEDLFPAPLVTAELEQAILVAFLCGNSHNYSHLLDGRPPGAAPWQVRRAEEYIEANWDQPITIEALAVVANASARSIFHSFRECRGFSPMKFVKQVRLRHVREMLSNPAPRATVTRVAFACGFGNLGHFANDYQIVFGETPSATLNRARGRSLS
jgi:AraC-like DNA-binding protein